MKPIEFSKHSLQQGEERGASREEIQTAILKGEKAPAKKGRYAFRFNFQYNHQWGGKTYAIKQVMPVIVEEFDKIIVVTVYVFYF